MVTITLALLVVGVKNEKKKSVLVMTRNYEDENDTENKARNYGELLNHFNKARGHGFTIQLSGNYFLPEAII